MMLEASHMGRVKVAKAVRAADLSHMGRVRVSQAGSRKVREMVKARVSRGEELLILNRSVQQRDVSVLRTFHIHSECHAMKRVRKRDSYCLMMIESSS